MADWYVDKGLATLITQMKQKHPGMVVGTIAGGGHVATWPATDHAPEPDGSVDAADWMLGKAFTRDECNEFVNTLVHNRDDRLAYIIWERRIISSTVNPWVWRPYDGEDPHTEHAHTSVNDKHESDASPWKLSTEEDDMFVKKGDGGDWVTYWQNVLVRLGYDLGEIDGIYGPKMEAAVNESRADGGQGTHVKITPWHAAFMHEKLAQVS